MRLSRTPPVSIVSVVVTFLLSMALAGCLTLAKMIDAVSKKNAWAAAAELQMVYESAKSRGDRKKMALNAFYIANIYSGLEHYRGVADWATVAVDLARSENLQEILRPSLVKLAEAHMELGENRLALASGSEAIEALRVAVLRDPGNELNLKSALMVVGEVYAREGEIETALTYFNEAIALSAGKEHKKFIERLQTDIALAEEKRQPPSLSVTLKFSDQRAREPNGVLDAEERAEVIVTIENRGRGAAYDVTSMLSATGQGFALGPAQRLDRIAPGETRTLQIPVDGASDLGDGEARVQVEIQEKRGHGAKAVDVSFHTAHLQGPNLIVRFGGLNDGAGEPAVGNGDEKLDSGERGELVITVQNTGKGAAYDVLPVLKSSAKGLRIGTLGPVGTIGPGESREVRVPVEGTLDLGGGEATIMIEAKEKRGFDAKRLKVSFETVALARPSLVIKPDVRINDGTQGFASGDGDGTIENGETAELQVFVENKGVGEAYGVRLSLVEIVPVGVEVVAGVSDIGEIGVKETAKGKVVIRLPRNLTPSGLRARFKAEEVDRKAAQTEKVVALRTGSRAPSLMVDAEWNDGTSGQARGNGNGVWENGETVEGVVTVHNKGVLAAEEVGVRIQVVEEDIGLGKREFQVGRLEPNATSIPLRTTVSIPRTFDGKSVSIETIVEQRDFPEARERFVQTVTLRRPELVVTRRLLNQTPTEGEKIGNVMQGEETKLEVRVRNSGTLDARGVTLSVVSERPEIRLAGQKTVQIGAIAAGQVSEPILILLTVLRSVPTGEAGISVEVTQEDFDKVKQDGVLMVREEGAEEFKVAGEKSRPTRPMAPAPVATNPIVIVSAPPKGETVQDTFDLVWDEVRDVATLEVLVNGERIPRSSTRGIGLSEKGATGGPRRFRERIPLKSGLNAIAVIAYDLANERWEDRIQVTRLAERGEIWAVVIGVSKYQHIQSLQYARRDAEAFQAYLTDYLGVPVDHIKTLYDNEVTQRAMRSALGTWLRQKANKNDTVFIYYAGHGAPEADSASEDGDGFEKYLLPTDADPAELYSTALPMREIADIFGRLNAERVIFIADSCFSGASGGRTVYAANTRATLSEAFLERLSKGKGRVILSASRANEVSFEGPEYGGHGAFTYYLLEGLKGKADYSRDGDIDIDELYRYVAQEVPKATGQKQTPVKKGEVEGMLVVGRVK